MQILQVNNQKDLAKIMLKLNVDHYGVKIMVPKGVNHLIRVNAVSNIAANILKQEMLSLGGEVAVSRVRTKSPAPADVALCSRATLSSSASLSVRK